MNNSETTKYPLLEAVLAIQILPLQPMYTNGNMAQIFKVCVCAMEEWLEDREKRSKSK